MLYYSCYIILQQAAGAAAAPWSVAPGTPLARGGVGGGLLAARAPAAPRTPSHTPPQSRSAGVVRLAAAKVLAVEDAGDLSELTVNELKVYTYVYIYIYIFTYCTSNSNNTTNDNHNDNYSNSNLDNSRRG